MAINVNSLPEIYIGVIFKSINCSSFSMLLNISYWICALGMFGLQ